MGSSPASFYPSGVLFRPRLIYGTGDIVGVGCRGEGLGLLRLAIQLSDDLDNKGIFTSCFPKFLCFSGIIYAPFDVAVTTGRPLGDYTGLRFRVGDAALLRV